MHRNGVLLAGPLSGTTPPVPLADPDIALLSAFLAGAEPAAAASEVQSGALACFVPGRPPKRNILHRIEQLRQARLLIDGNAGAGGGARAVADCRSEERLRANRRLRPGRNFALAPEPGGYRIFSARDRCEHLLDTELALLLCAFRGNRRIRSVIREFPARADTESLHGAVSWLERRGLLVRHRALSPASESAMPQRSSTGRKQPSSNAERWQEMEPDGRIPVYFTPHMENHYPLALGMIYSAIRAHDDGALTERFQLLPITYLEPQDLLEGPFRKFGPGVWLFSNYMWSLDINLRISGFVKSKDPRNLTIHGGPSTPEYAEVCARFMKDHSSVDIAVHGEGEVTVVEILKCLERLEDGTIAGEESCLSKVDGLTFRTRPGTADSLVRTGPRIRQRQPDQVPSPYTTGVFDLYDGRVEAAIIESNRGCPFGCTFCDWGSATRQKVRKLDLDRVKEEVDWIGERGIKVLWIADANFGMYDRDIELARHIVDAKRRLGFPREVVVNYTKNTTRRLIEIIKAFSEGGIISQGIISIQTTDQATLEVINRKNIKTETYDELAELFAEANLPLSTDLMIGLPGITVEAFDRDLQRYFDADVTVKAYPTQLLPNSPMADPEYMRKYRIEVDENDFIVACHSFDRAELEEMKAVYHAFEIADGYSVLRYVLRYLQWDHDIPALRFLHALTDEVQAHPERYPSVTWVLRYFVREKYLPGGWRTFYDEIGRFTETRFGVDRDPAFATALLVNEMAMPDDMRAYPVTVRLDHDFMRYFLQHKAADENAGALADHPPAEFTVDDPDLVSHVDLEYLQYDSHQYFWEVRSAIARPRSAANLA